MEHSRDSLSDGLSGGGHMTSFLNNQKCECCGAALWLPEYKKDSYLPCLQWPSYTSDASSSSPRVLHNVYAALSHFNHTPTPLSVSFLCINLPSWLPNEFV
ncbi:uncharacterized protein LACBIDRAFT_332709 [Laccaria bicolor S238N-H82]|uniref:Predicted protein n=1 Tax=Laccaria bicolor (strain S238N-H82 / ATCC MYA-4686) TaxID=486041 RepID=B0DTM8_LACBS|nr:uncharacterized protein LACBIDRAFT_332709 [Laccaria bicolor S238N-H82]EDR02084.1 predicted protein [Laccaria bicolor S238N-H82]|eukprot:XP_001887241.1 predicted protein [Laccaria bicolor S238N-H82]